MRLRNLSVMARSPRKEEMWVKEVREALKNIEDITVGSAREMKETANIVLLDTKLGNFEEILETFDRKKQIIVAVAASPSKEGDQKEIEKSEERVRAWLKDERIDDSIGYPFRALELNTKLRFYELLVVSRDVIEISSSFANLVRTFEEDLNLVERIQKAKYPKKFGDLKGYRVVSRYLAGYASGGDYFDVVESSDQEHLSMILTHSSSYGLSSTVLSVLMRVMLKLSSDQIEESGSPNRVIRRIYEEILMTLNIKDHLSIFYGIISRKNLTLRYLNLGSSVVYHAEPNGLFRQLAGSGEAISKETRPSHLEKDGKVESTLELKQGSQLVLASPGLIEILGGAEAVKKVLDEGRPSNQDQLGKLNELIFRIKSTTSPGELVARDCTALLVDLVGPSKLRSIGS